MIKKRIVKSLDREWSFHLGDIKPEIGVDHGSIYNTSKAGSELGVPQSDFDSRDWERVDLPHDWSVKREFDESGSPSWGYKPKGKAWYRKSFPLDADFEGKQITIDFDGITKNAVVYFNGSIVKRSFTGYIPFSIDITDRAVLGGAPNTLAVFADADDWEGWWYEGAGIYRHVWLNVKNKVNIDKYGVFANPKKLSDTNWNVEIETVINNRYYNNEVVSLETKIYELNKDLKIVGGCIASGTTDMIVYEYSKREFMQNICVKEPNLWDIENPNLYKAVSVVYINGEQVDECETVFGFRTIKFDSYKGFFLNGKPVKILGTCNHQDHGGLGVALPDSINEYRIQRLREMGSNAYRCAHGMPSKELLDACDRMGMLVMDENRLFETNDDNLENIRTMVRRDRNHPSVIMYSVFNEEPLQSAPEGRKMAERIKAEIKLLDNTRFVTGAMHGGVLEENGAANVLDVCGINYQPQSYDDFHEKYPRIPIIASETTSAFSVRGCYKKDEEVHEISGYDENASDWGNTVRETWDYVLNRDFVSGAFMWTGFDYLGEPTPYEWPSVSSFFGMMDTCGFPKDGYYLSKAIFSKEPVCYAVPHWNWKGKEGTIIKVMSMTNCDEAELFINGNSKGKKPIDKLKQAIWNVPFESGELKLVGYIGTKVAAVDIKNTTGDAVDLIIKPWRNYMYNDGCDAIPVNIYAVDENGEVVPDANFKIKFFADGGKVLGMANGNPNCHEDFASNERSVFNGCCQAVVRLNEGAESLTLTAQTDIINVVCDDIQILERESIPFVESIEELYISNWRMSVELSDEKPDPNAVFLSSDMNSLEPVSVTNGAQEKFSENSGKYALYRAKVNIPDKINGKKPMLHFNSIWGICEVYIDGIKIADCDYEWPCGLDAELKGFSGKKEITVIIKSRNFGAGICSSVVIR